MKPIVFITEVREFLEGLETRQARRAFSTMVTSQCRKNASRSHQLLILNAAISELKAQGKKVPCVPSLAGSTSESVGSAPVSTSDDATSETGCSEPVSTSTLVEVCGAN